MGIYCTVVNDENFGSTDFNTADSYMLSNFYHKAIDAICIWCGTIVALAKQFREIFALAR